MFFKQFSLPSHSVSFIFAIFDAYICFVCVLTGYLSNDLQKAFVHLIDHDVCDQLYTDYNIIEEAEICAGYIRGGVDSCQVIFTLTKYSFYMKV